VTARGRTSPMARGGASVAPATGKSFSFIFFSTRGEEKRRKKKSGRRPLKHFFTHLSGKQTGQFSFRFGRRKRLIFFPRHDRRIFLTKKNFQVPPGGLGREISSERPFPDLRSTRCKSRPLQKFNKNANVDISRVNVIKVTWCVNQFHRNQFVGTQSWT